MTQYLRLKRKEETIFMHTEPSDSFGQIASRIGEMFDKAPSDVALFRFYYKDYLVSRSKYDFYILKIDFLSLALLTLQFNSEI